LSGLRLRTFDLYGTYFSIKFTGAKDACRSSVPQFGVHLHVVSCLAGTTCGLKNDPISAVYELALKSKLTVNFDTVTNKGGFMTKCTVGDKVTTGEGNNKKVCQTGLQVCVVLLGRGHSFSFLLHGGQNMNEHNSAIFKM
jgi:hypothetical protein